MKALRKYFNPYLWAIFGFTLLPTVWVATRPLKPESISVEAKHAKNMAAYLKRNECKRLKQKVETVPNIYFCKDGAYTFPEISVHVWQEMQ